MEWEKTMLDLAELLPEHGAAVSEDSAQLWRRVVFSIAVHNTDDHMRNHGFLRLGSGWRLAPIFDVNPDPHLGETRATSIAGAGSAEEIDGVMALATYCGLSAKQARQIIGDVLVPHAHLSCLNETPRAPIAVPDCGQSAGQHPPVVAQPGLWSRSLADR